MLYWVSDEKKARLEEKGEQILDILLDGTCTKQDTNYIIDYVRQEIVKSQLTTLLHN